VFIAPLDQAGRAVGTLGEANSLGAFSLFLFPFALSLSVSKKRKTFLMIGVFLCTALVVFFSGSRSALIGLVAQTLFLFLYKKNGIPKAGILTVVFVIFSLFLPFADVKQTFDSRTEIWNTAWQAGQTRPLFGWGVGNVEHGLRETAKELQNPLRFQYVDSSHNVFLDCGYREGYSGFHF
jgi:O-antigen ligase